MEWQLVTACYGQLVDREEAMIIEHIDPGWISASHRNVKASLEE